MKKVNSVQKMCIFAAEVYKQKTEKQYEQNW